MGEAIATAKTTTLILRVEPASKMPCESQALIGMTTASAFSLSR